MEPEPPTTAPEPDDITLDTPLSDSSTTTTLSQTSETPSAPAGRVDFRSPRIEGSINLRGARIDELRLLDYRETVDPTSPTISLLGSADSRFTFAEFGFTSGDDTSGTGAPGTLPGPNTIWRHDSSGDLTPTSPITLSYENERGVSFRRTISLDENYMFTISDSVDNPTLSPVIVRPYGRISRRGDPNIQGIFILHEGLIDAVGDEGLEYIDYDDLEDSGIIRRPATDKGWLGITDKYWASLLIPDHRFTAAHRYGSNTGTYQSEYIGESTTIAPSGNYVVSTRLFAGAKEVEIIDRYQSLYNLELFDKVIDWGWLYWLTKPLFFLIDWIFGYVGNFGVAILLATVLIKLAFFPLAHKSYVSMANMKRVQPELMAIREQHGDDRQAQSKAMMDLYRKERINPAAGCWPILVQIPVFFALYTVLYITIEMRHAPFFGWIVDLSAPDPTSIFNLFGLLPYSVPSLLLVGVWPLIMGFTMFIQMQMNPTPPDPVQQMIFRWMPVVFTFLLATFPAGLVIYWSWNNFLSILQQGTIMKRQGAKIELWDNLKLLFLRKNS